MKEIRNGAILSYLSIFLTFFVSIVYTPIMIQMLGQEEYGLYALMMVLVGYFSILDLGFGNAIVRYISRNRATGDKVMEAALNGFFLKLFIAIGFIALGIGFILYTQMDMIFGSSLTIEQLNKTKMMLIFMTISMALQFPLSVFTSILQAYEKFVFIKFISLSQAILQPLTMLFFLLNGADSVAMIGIVAFYNVLFLMIEAFICMKILDISFTFRRNSGILKKEIFVFAFFIFVTVIVDKIYWQTDQMLLGIIKGTTDVAVYAIAMQIVMIFMSLALAISNLFLPRMSILVTEEDSVSQINQLFIKVGSIQFLIISYVLGGFFLFGREFIAMWVGQEFLDVYKIVLIIMLPFTIDLIQNLGLSVLKAKNLFKFRTLLLISIALVNLVLSIPAIQFFGLMGAAIITAFSLLIGNVIIMNVYYYKKLQLDIKGFWARIIRLLVGVSLATATMKLIVNIFNPKISWVSLVGFILLYGLFLGISIVQFGLSGNQRKIGILMVKKLYSNILNKRIEQE
ncbi:lipopolysaccharide biosynthesis protein [Lysinibacillus sp. NPDC059133]|uniref:lipopolysaccharide biosynthesis protein n=1 Tax=Lysinibacillus sp. NPDC059133 TaxID=3346737 RepID=UPI0036A38EF9